MFGTEDEPERVVRGQRLRDASEGKNDQTEPKGPNESPRVWRFAAGCRATDEDGAPSSDLDQPPNAPCRIPSCDGGNQRPDPEDTGQKEEGPVSIKDRGEVHSMQEHQAQTPQGHQNIGPPNAQGRDFRLPEHAADQHECGQGGGQMKVSGVVDHREAIVPEFRCGLTKVGECFNLPVMRVSLSDFHFVPIPGEKCGFLDCGSVSGVKIT